MITHDDLMLMLGVGWFVLAMLSVGVMVLGVLAWQSARQTRTLMELIEEDRKRQGSV